MEKGRKGLRRLSSKEHRKGCLCLSLFLPRLLQPFSACLFLFSTEEKCKTRHSFGLAIWSLEGDLIFDGNCTLKIEVKKGQIPLILQSCDLFDLFKGGAPFVHPQQRSATRVVFVRNATLVGCSEERIVRFSARRKLKTESLAPKITSDGHNFKWGSVAPTPEFPSTWRRPSWSELAIS